ncbi:MAG: hypothetical protein ACFFEN_17725 [Candidatus Thorarchaeota archaeon]
MPCYLKYPKISTILDGLKEQIREKVLDELLKQKSDEELHQMSEDEILELILKIIYWLRMKKMAKEVEMIYV